MTNHIKIKTRDKVIFEGELENCSECPCYNNGAYGEYPEQCTIGPEYMDMPAYGSKGMSPQCPLLDTIEHPIRTTTFNITKDFHLYSIWMQ